MLRGYPTSMTGYYSADPSFGNLLRVALELNFRIHAYESIQRTPEAREKGQALHLARILSSDPKMKLVVHAGYAHVFKRNHPDDLRTMASYLWEETGIEPYTIYQSWHSREELESRELSKLLAAEGEPRMLESPPRLPMSPQFNFAGAGGQDGQMSLDDQIQVIPIPQVGGDDAPTTDKGLPHLRDVWSSRHARHPSQDPSGAIMTLTEAHLKRFVDPRYVDRGRAYFERGQVVLESVTDREAHASTNRGSTGVPVAPVFQVSTSTTQ